MSSTARGLIVLSPVGIPPARTPAESTGAVPRLRGLSGRVIGIVDDGLPGAEAYLRGVGDRLAAAHAGVQIRYWRKPALSRPAPPALLEEVARSCDAAVVGVCG